MPSERELAERFDVSRTTIREAIRHLESIGCVETKVGAGSYVKTPDTAQIADDFSSELLQGDVMNCDVLEFRTIIDCEVGALAAARRSMEQLQALQDNVDRLRESINNGTGMEDYEKLDKEFHFLLAKATNNNVLINLVRMSEGLYGYTINLSFAVDGMPVSGLKQHEEILDAVINRDAQKARTLIRRHILRTIYRD